ncbi:unnamed protein product, partial [Didymodactylos carnosus]
MGSCRGRRNSDRAIRGVYRVAHSLQRPVAFVGYGPFTINPDP